MDLYVVEISTRRIWKVLKRVGLEYEAVCLSTKEIRFITIGDRYKIVLAED